MEIPHFCAASSTDMYSIKPSFAQYHITLRATYQWQLDIKKGCITFVSYLRILQNAVATMQQVTVQDSEQKKKDIHRFFGLTA